MVATLRDYDAAIVPWQRESVATVARFALVLLFVIHFIRSGRERIQGARKLSDQLLETASVMVIGLDRENRIVLFNRMAEQIAGYTRTESYGKDCFDL